MTDVPDPLAGSPLAAAETPDGMIGFGLAEFAFIASADDTPASRVSRDFLGINPADEHVQAYGPSALVARGLMTSAGDNLEPRSHAALLRAVLASSDRWTRVGILNEEHPGVAFYLEAPGLVALIEPSAVGTWWVRFGDDPSVGPTLVSTLVSQRLEFAPESACIVDSRGLAPDRHNLLTTTRPDGSFAAYVDAQPGGTGGTEIAVPATGLEPLVRALMTAGRA